MKAGKRVPMDRCYEYLAVTPPRSFAPTLPLKGRVVAAELPNYLADMAAAGLGAVDAVWRIWRHSFSRRSNWAWEICWAGMGDPFVLSATTDNARLAGRFRSGCALAVENSEETVSVCRLLSRWISA